MERRLFEPAGRSLIAAQPKSHQALHLRWWMLPSLPSTVYFLGLSELMQCKPARGIFIGRRHMCPEQSLPLSPSFLSLCGLCWATHGGDSPLIALPGTSRKPLGWNVLSKALPPCLQEKTSRENSGVDSLTVISTSGTESLIPSNL